MIDERLSAVVREQPYPLLFVTVSGAHLYGFASPDSDYDLRGVHILPTSDVVGLFDPKETIEYSGIRDDMELDIVTHDIRKFFKLLLKRNGYVLEQLYSPLVVHTTPEHQELKRVAQGCITRHHSHHYMGFADTQWKLFMKESPHRLKPILYTFRVLLAGIHLMQSGAVESSLVHLSELFHITYLLDLITSKTCGSEQAVLGNTDIDFFEKEFHRLRDQLQTAEQESNLPDKPLCMPALNDLLVQIRLG